MSKVFLAAAPVVNLYALPSLDAEVVSQLRYGWPAEPLEQAEGWVKLQTQDGYAGWAVVSSCVPQPDLSSLLQVSALSANLYLDADVKLRAPALNVPFESRLQLVAAEQARWLQVRLLDGRLAYVHSGDVTALPTPIPLLQALSQAERFLGITYTWGGTSSYGFDCSGFVQMVFRQAGINLPRDAQAQCDWPGFQAIDKAALLPGDVLFFSDCQEAEKTAHDQINHVAIYTGDPSPGPGRFLHDTTSEAHPGIQFSHLADQPWRDRLTACRRLAIDAA